MHLLKTEVKGYAWGDRARLHAFADLPGAGSPAAELWVGTHPDGASQLPDGRSLREEVELPYLLKLLAAAEPLSLQVHPDRDQARRGFAREEADGPAREAPDRNFKDDRHKPELFVALDDSLLLAGFRPVPEAVALLEDIGGPTASRMASALTSGGAPALAELFGQLLQGRPEGAEDLAVRLTERAAAGGSAMAGSGQPGAASDPARASSWAASVEVAADLYRRYPDDQSWLISLLLNLVALRPGEAIFVEAGVLHAHLRGFGIEIMAASDNVLRAGMTGKHMDRDLVRECTVVRPALPELVSMAQVSRGVRLVECGAEEFALLVVDAPADHEVGHEDEVGDTAYGIEVPAAGPRLVLTIEGEVTVHAGGQDQVLPRGRAVYVPASEGELRLTGPGQAVVAAVPAEVGTT
ncbi:mannose-6-phosphate isomerase, class I [Ornithinimicrobium sp. Y1694]|uniref:mannose-6-phosphate isomerase, class I n=1 Tax=Ornithinimicrobium sp. Y1694 TaxID=3418590 RepID=UPI003CF30FE6